MSRLRAILTGVFGVGPIPLDVLPIEFPQVVVVFDGGWFFHDDYPMLSNLMSTTQEIDAWVRGEKAMLDAVAKSAKALLRGAQK